MVRGRTGHHEATVTVDDRAVGWDAGTCVRHDGRVLVSDDALEVAGECVDVR